MSALRIIVQNILLFVAVAASFLWSKDEELSYSTPQLIALFIIIFFAAHFAAKKIVFLKNNKLTFNFFLISIVSYILIFQTGGLSSPLFFLSYFLLFAITILDEPFAALFLALFSSIFFLLTPRKDLLYELIQLSSLFMITPLAIIFASQYKKIEQTTKEIDYLKNEAQVLTKEVVSQESQVKYWTQKELKERLVKIWENLEALGSQNADVTKGKIQEISNQLANLLKSADSLEKRIEK